MRKVYVFLLKIVWSILYIVKFLTCYLSLFIKVVGIISPIYWVLIYVYTRSNLVNLAVLKLSIELYLNITLALAVTSIFQAVFEQKQGELLEVLKIVWQEAQAEANKHSVPIHNYLINSLKANLSEKLELPAATNLQTREEYRSKVEKIRLKYKQYVLAEIAKNQ